MARRAKQTHQGCSKEASDRRLDGRKAKLKAQQLIEEATPEEGPRGGNLRRGTLKRRPRRG